MKSRLFQAMLRVVPWLCLVPALALGADSRGVTARRATSSLTSDGIFADLPLSNAPAARRMELTAATTPAAAPSRPESGLGRRMDGLDAKQKLGVGDKVTFRVLEDQEEPKTLTVTDAGELDVPELGLVKAEKRTCKELAFEIKTKLEQTTYYHATVIIGVDTLNKTMSGRRVYVMGEVQHPGPQEIPAGETWTVAKAIMRTGGFTVYAAKNKVRVVRSGGKGMTGKSITVNVADIWEKGRTELDVPVEPEDVIVVPPRGVNFY